MCYKPRIYGQHRLKRGLVHLEIPQNLLNAFLRCCPLCLIPHSEVPTDGKSVLGAKTFNCAIQLRERTYATCQSGNQIIETGPFTVGHALLASVGYKFLKSTKDGLQRLDFSENVLCRLRCIGHARDESNDILTGVYQSDN